MLFHFLLGCNTWNKITRVRSLFRKVLAASQHVWNQPDWLKCTGVFHVLKMIVPGLSGVFFLFLYKIHLYQASIICLGSHPSSFSGYRSDWRGEVRARAVLLSLSAAVEAATGTDTTPDQLHLVLSDQLQAEISIQEEKGEVPVWIGLVF